MTAEPEFAEEHANVLSHFEPVAGQLRVLGMELVYDYPIPAVHSCLRAAASLT